MDDGEWDHYTNQRRSHIQRAEEERHWRRVNLILLTPAAITAGLAIGLTVGGLPSAATAPAMISLAFTMAVLVRLAYRIRHERR